MSDDPRWAHLMELFMAARDVPAARREAWLEQVCGTDTALRQEVERMLAADARSEGILERVPALSPDPLLGLPAALADRYELGPELGEGGMARVFLAQERKHGRPVVLKALRPEVARHFGRDRFLREVRILAQLAHPHIIGLIDSGEAGGVLYYVMPYLPGETLRDRLAREGRLELSAARTLLRDTALALGHAHRAGVIHRDLKPSNILCVGEHAYVMDFGIAKLRERTPGEDPATETGKAIGTPAYMAPEQRVADPTLDHRADLHAWGLVAYETLMGQLPGPDWLAPTAGEIADARPDLPVPLAVLIAECMSPSPADRPADADRIVRVLDGGPPSGPVVPPRARRVRGRGLLLAGLAMVLVTGAALWPFRPRSAGMTDRMPGPVAVAAFVNETGDSTLDIWGRMAGDWLTEGLQSTGLVPVIPWPTALHASLLAQGGQADQRTENVVKRLREETGAATVVSGSYYRVGDSLRFQAEVSDARGGRLLGALAPLVVSVDAPEAGIEELRRRLMGMVALWRDERVANVASLARRPPTYEAYQTFDRGLDHFRDQDYSEAAKDFLHAFALDTQFVSTLLSAATATWNDGQIARTDSLLQAARAREGALTEYQRLRLESLSARLAGDAVRELAALRRAVSIAPNSMASYNLSEVALNSDRPEEALLSLREIDPDRGDMRGWAPYWYNLTHALHLMGDHVAEAGAAQELRRRYPDRRVGLVFEVRARAAVGDTAAIESLLTTSQGLPPTTYWSHGAALVVAGEELMTHGYGQAGWPYLTRAVRWLDRQLALTPGDRAHRYWLASALYDLGAWRRSYDVALGLTREFPDRLTYRGLAALSAARLQLTIADSLLGTPAPYQRGSFLVFRARLAAIRGLKEEATGLFSEAVRAGVDGLPWLHASAVDDLFLLGPARANLPRSLQVGVAPFGPTPPAP